LIEKKKKKKKADPQHENESRAKQGLERNRKKIQRHRHKLARQEKVPAKDGCRSATHASSSTRKRRECGLLTSTVATERAVVRADFP
jgi:hypothetical protein